MIFIAGGLQLSGIKCIGNRIGNRFDGSTRSRIKISPNEDRMRLLFIKIPMLSFV